MQCPSCKKLTLVRDQATSRSAHAGRWRLRCKKIKTDESCGYFKWDDDLINDGCPRCHKDLSRMDVKIAGPTSSKPGHPYLTCSCGMFIWKVDNVVMATAILSSGTSTGRGREAGREAPAKRQRVEQMLTEKHLCYCNKPSWIEKYKGPIGQFTIVQCANVEDGCAFEMKEEDGDDHLLQLLRIDSQRKDKLISDKQWRAALTVLEARVEARASLSDAGGKSVLDCALARRVIDLGKKYRDGVLSWSAYDEQMEKCHRTFEINLKATLTSRASREFLWEGLTTAPSLGKHVCNVDRIGWCLFDGEEIDRPFPPDAPHDPEGIDKPLYEIQDGDADTDVSVVVARIGYDLAGRLGKKDATLRSAAEAIMTALGDKKPSRICILDSVEIHENAVVFSFGS